jgi:hypothetical protein
MRVLNRLELVSETQRAALNAIAVVTSAWLRGVTSPDWHDRYDRRVEDARLSETGLKRDAYAAQVGTDGFRLLAALDIPGSPGRCGRVPSVAMAASSSNIASTKTSTPAQAFHDPRAVLARPTAVSIMSGLGAVDDNAAAACCPSDLTCNPARIFITSATASPLYLQTGAE